jgi:hypothetical protein
LICHWSGRWCRIRSRHQSLCRSDLPPRVSRGTESAIGPHAELDKGAGRCSCRRPGGAAHGKLAGDATRRTSRRAGANRLGFAPAVLRD